MVNCTAVIAKPKYASAVLEIASAGAAGNDKAPATTDANPAKSLRLNSCQPIQKCDEYLPHTWHHKIGRASCRERV